VVSMLASGTQVRGFKPDRNRRIFRAKKSSACRRTHVVDLWHVERSLKGVVKAPFLQNYRTPFSPTVPSFATRSARVVGDVEASGGESGNV
jgi:hypothetical protein